MNLNFCETSIYFFQKMSDLNLKLKRKYDFNSMPTDFKDHVIDLIIKTNDIDINQFVDDKCWSFLQAIG